MDVTPPPYQRIRMDKGFTRTEFLRTFRAVTGKDVKLRTLRAWESGQNEAPMWFVAGFCRVLNVSADAVLGVSPPGDVSGVDAIKEEG